MPLGDFPEMWILGMTTSASYFPLSQEGQYANSQKFNSNH